MEDEELELPGAPDPDDKVDPRNRFKEYLNTQIARRQMMPEYQDKADSAREGLHQAKDNANLGALLMDSASRFGMAGGKQVQSSFQPFAQNLSSGLDKYMGDQDARRQRADQQDMETMKLYQYLAQQRGQEDASKLAQYKAQTDRKKLEKEAQTKQTKGEFYVDPVSGEEYVRDPLTGQSRKTGTKYGVKPDKPEKDNTVKYTNDLNDSWDKAPTTKTTREMQTALGKIQNADASAAGDMSLIYGFMKMQDPGSTVREGEYASAENARGVESSVLNLYNKIRTGQRLTPEQRQAFKASATNIYKAQIATQKQTDKYIRDRANALGLNPNSLVITDFEKETPQGLVTPAAVSGQAIGADANTKVIGGKTYRRVEGGWEEVD